MVFDSIFTVRLERPDAPFCLLALHPAPFVESFSFSFSFFLSCGRGFFLSLRHLSFRTKWKPAFESRGLDLGNVLAAAG